MLDENKKKALATAVSTIEKQYGKGSIMVLGQSEVQPMEVIPTGCLALDRAIGIGGYPRGRIIEIYGPESSGKTTVTLHAIASCQKQGGLAAFIDAEHALDPMYAQKLGINLDELLISQPDSGEQALDIAESLVRSNAVDMVVIDSVAALVPQAELDGEMGDNFVGLQARMLSKCMRKMAGAINKSKCVCIFINQIREKVGVVYGPSETTTGGRALKYFASVRIEVRKIEDLKSGTDKIGVRTKAKVVKNKVAPPFKETAFEIYYGQGISQSADMIEIALADGIITKGGAWFTYGEQRWQGKDNLRKEIESNEELKQSLLNDLEKSFKKHLADGKNKESDPDTEVF